MKVTSDLNFWKESFWNGWSRAFDKLWKNLKKRGNQHTVNSLRFQSPSLGLLQRTHFEVPLPLLFPRVSWNSAKLLKNKSTVKYFWIFCEAQNPWEYLTFIRNASRTPNPGTVWHRSGNPWDPTPQWLKAACAMGQLLSFKQVKWWEVHSTKKWCPNFFEESDPKQ